MIQLNAHMAQIASTIGAPVAPDASDGSFPDLLGLLLKGRLGALPSGTQGAWIVAADPAATPGLTQATINPGQGGQDAQSGEAAETLLTQLLAHLMHPGVVLPGAVAEAGNRGLGPGQDVQGQKKLPTLPAGLAGLLVQDEAGAPSGKTAAELLKSIQAKPELYFQGGLPLSLSELKQVLETFAGTPARAALTPSGIPATESLAQLLPPVAAMPAVKDGDPALAVPRLTAQMSAPFASPEWRTELGERVAWMVGRHAQVAELILNPPNLGTIEVHLKMNLSGNEAGAQFFTNNPAVREALENAFPRLRELMAEAGIALGDASVNQHSHPRGESEAMASGGPSDQGDEGLTHADEALNGVILAHGRLSARVDVYI